MAENDFCQHRKLIEKDPDEPWALQVKHKTSNDESIIHKTYICEDCKMTILISVATGRDDNG